MKELPIPVVRYLGAKNPGEQSAILREENAVGAIEKYLKTRTRAKKTEAGYRKDIEEFEEWVGVPLEEVRSVQIEGYSRHLEEERKLKPATVNRKVSALKGFYEWMVCEELVRENPVVVRSKPVAKVTVEPLTAEEIQVLLRATWSGPNPERDEALIWVLVSGVKIVEAIGLDWGDYDGQRLVVGGRRVELVGEAIESLNEYMKLRGCSGDDPIFVSESHLSRGQRLSYEGVRGILGWLSELTEIDGMNRRSSKLA